MTRAIYSISECQPPNFRDSPVQPIRWTCGDDLTGRLHQAAQVLSSCHRAHSAQPLAICLTRTHSSLGARHSCPHIAVVSASGRAASLRPVDDGIDDAIGSELRAFKNDSRTSAPLDRGSAGLRGLGGDRSRAVCFHFDDIAALPSARLPVMSSRSTLERDFCSRGSQKKLRSWLASYRSFLEEVWLVQRSEKT